MFLLSFSDKLLFRVEIKNKFTDLDYRNTDTRRLCHKCQKIVLVFKFQLHKYLTHCKNTATVGRTTGTLKSSLLRDRR